MKSKVSLLLVFVILNGALFAQDDDPPHSIDVAMEKAMDINPSTAGQIEATDAALEKWNHLLNEQYQRLMKSLGNDARAKLQSSQKGWIAWRDLEILALGAIYGEMEGSIWLPAHRYAVMNLTRERAKRLMVLNSFYGEVFEFGIRGQKVQIEPVMTRAEIKKIFQRVAPESSPSVDDPKFLQYDIVLKFEQAPASFVFDFDESGSLAMIRMDAYTADQIPTVDELIKDLAALDGEPYVEGNSKTWHHGGWEFSHEAGGIGEDSHYNMTIIKK